MGCYQEACRNWDGHACPCALVGLQPDIGAEGESGTPHNPFARECIVHGVPVRELVDVRCPACRELSALVDLDPDYGSAPDGRPWLGGGDRG